MPRRRRVRAHQLGLIGTGWVSKTFLPGLAFLKDELGPVYSPSRRATPRLVKALGAGFAVGNIEEAQSCRHLLVCAAEDSIEDLVKCAFGAGVFEDVELIAFVEAPDSYEPPAGVASADREVGFLSQLPFRQNPTYLVQGSMRFRRFCQQMLAVPLRMLVMSPRESQTLVKAGLFLSSEFCLPLMEAAQSCFAMAGVAEDHARELSAAMLGEAVENARFAGKKRWNGILNGGDPVRLQQILCALREKDRRMAEVVEGFSERALQAMRLEGKWTGR